MKIVCIPVVDDRGLESPVALAFAGAPYFLLVDADTLASRAIPNSAQRQRERGCDPCEALGDTAVDVVVVAEIDAGALGQLTRRKLPVHGGARGTAADALAALMGGGLPVLRTGS